MEFTLHVASLDDSRSVEYEMRLDNLAPGSEVPVLLKWENRRMYKLTPVEATWGELLRDAHPELRIAVERIDGAAEEISWFNVEELESNSRGDGH